MEEPGSAAMFHKMQCHSAEPPSLAPKQKKKNDCTNWPARAEMVDELFCLRFYSFLTVLFLIIPQNQKGQPGLVISNHSAAPKPAVDRKGLVQKHYSSFSLGGFFKEFFFLF